MNVASSISSPPPSDGAVVPEFLRGFLLVSYWWWTEMFCRAELASSEVLSPEPLTMAARAERLGFADMSAVPHLRLSKIHRLHNRHERRMIARRRRGIVPASRYGYYGMGGPLRAGYSLAELQDWARHRYALGWFQHINVKYYLNAFFRRAALWLARKSTAMSQLSCDCPAPLSPD